MKIAFFAVLIGITIFLILRFVGKNTSSGCPGCEKCQGGCRDASAEK